MSSIANTTAPAFKPAFTRVQQTDDCNCAFACIAMLAGKTLDEVRQIAIDKFKHPKHGPYWIGEDLIAKLLTTTMAGLAPCSRRAPDLPPCQIRQLRWSTTTPTPKSAGTFCLTVQPHRVPSNPSSTSLTRRIGSIRFSKSAPDIKGFPISWFVGVHPMPKTVAKTDK